MRVSAKQYAQTLFELTDGKSKSEIEKSVAGFARYIYRNRKLKMADKISEQFSKIYNQKHGIVEAQIVTSKKMSEGFEKKVEHFVKEKYGAKKIVLKNVVDENIKGGMILRVGDEIMDNSILGRINKLKQELTK